MTSTDRTASSARTAYSGSAASAVSAGTGGPGAAARRSSALALPRLPLSRRSLLLGAGAATAALAGGVLAAPDAEATDTLPWEGDREAGPHRPAQRGYNPDQVLAWSADTDPDAWLLRARIPLQGRAEALPAAQRRPELPAATQSLMLAGDYGNAFFESWHSADIFAQHLFEYWQHVDVMASWHGMASVGAPESLYHPEEEWTQRWFEFGAVNLPNPGYTDAAHRNGVLSLGTIFFSDNDRGSQHFAELLVRADDGSFPAAAQLIAMAEHFGFDGYFVNQEQVSVAMTADERTAYREFMVQLREGGMYVQWYDSVTDAGRISYQNEFNAANSPWVENGEQGRVSDSIFLNYWWNRSKLTASAAHASELGLDPLSTVFTGVEAGMYQFSQPYDLDQNLDDDGVPMTAIATLGADFVHADMDGKTDNALQHAAFDRARRWWTGSSTGTGTPADEGGRWQGIATYIAERTAITGDAFHTSFSTGHGLGWWQDGVRTGEREWGAIGVQDIPVTWQWWFSTDESDADDGSDSSAAAGSLQADIAYGPDFVSADRFSYTPVEPYEGGSTLVVSGTLAASTTLRLFRTDLEVGKDTELSMTVQVSAGSPVLSAVIALADDPTALIRLPLALDGDTGGWSTATVDLSAHAGARIAVIGLGLGLDLPDADGTDSTDGADGTDGTGTADGAEPQDVQVDLGALTVASSRAKAPARPHGLRIERALPGTQELLVAWDLADFSEVSRYELSVDGVHLGAVYGDVLYVEDFTETTGTLELVAVGHDGRRSRAATLDVDLTALGAVQVDAATRPGEVTVSWDQPCHASTRVSITALDAGPAPFTTTVKASKGATSLVITGVPTDGSRFLAVVDDRRTTAVGAVGAFADTELAPYPAEAATIDGRSLVLTRPTPDDWSTLTILEDDEPLPFATTYSQGERDHWTCGRATRASLSKTLASAESRVVAVLTDYAGNSVETVLREGA
ncbi:endo-beta-N-acetylglucosaminidase [Brachybacterium sp. DNPG3]